MGSFSNDNPEHSSGRSLSIDTRTSNRSEYIGTSKLRRWIVFALALLASAVFVRGERTEANKLSANVCVTAVDEADGQEWSTWWYMGPQPGRRLIVHAEARDPCDVVVAVSDHRTGKLAYGWLPQFITLTAGQAAVLPAPPTKWSWEKDNIPIDINVLVLPSGATESRELRKLVTAMAESRSDDVLSKQTSKLRELMAAAGEGANETDRGTHYAGGSDFAGTLRHIRPKPFDWHDYARSVSFSASHGGSTVFSNAQWLKTRSPAP